MDSAPVCVLLDSLNGRREVGDALLGLSESTFRVVEATHVIVATSEELTRAARLGALLELSIVVHRQCMFMMLVQVV